MMRPYYRNLLLPFGSGFHLEDPPADLLERRYLYSDDPEDVICSVLAHAQRGHFDVCERLLDVLARHDDGDVWASCSTLLSFAAPRAVLHEFALRAMNGRIGRGGDAPLQWAAETLAHTHELWVVKAMLELFMRIEALDQFMAIPVYLSLLLEPEPGKIDGGPQRIRDASEPDWYDPPPRWDRQGYVDLVEQHMGELDTGLPARWRACWCDGELLGLRGLAERTLMRINAPDEHALRIVEARMLLEAYTGERFAGFHDPDSHALRRLDASARLESFLSSDVPERFEPGVRYFFGRVIPD